MTPQSPRTSLLEAATQSLVGLPLGFAVVTAVSLLGLSPAAAGALSAGLMFVVSTARGYAIRRRFAKRDAVIDEWRRNVAAYDEEDYEARRRSATHEHIPHGSL
jgi:hypothetical protein